MAGAGDDAGHVRAVAPVVVLLGLAVREVHERLLQEDEQQAAAAEREHAAAQKGQEQRPEPDRPRRPGHARDQAGEGKIWSISPHPLS